MKSFQRFPVARSFFAFIVSLLGSGCNPIMDPVGSMIEAEDVVVEPPGDEERGEEDPRVDDPPGPDRDSVDPVLDEIQPDVEIPPDGAPLALYASQVIGIGGDWGWQATFYTMFQGDPEKRCYYREVGPCGIVDCRSSRYGSGELPWVSAGPVTFTTSTTYDIIMEPDENGIYYKQHGTGIMWSPDDIITIFAPGDELPSFKVDAVMPTPVNTLEPDMESSIDAIPISRSEAFTLTWEPTDGEVGIEMGETPSENGNETMLDFYDVSCIFPGSSGAGEIPVEFISEFDGGQRLFFICAEHIKRHLGPLGERTLIWGAGNIICRNAVIE